MSLSRRSLLRAAPGLGLLTALPGRPAAALPQSLLDLDAVAQAQLVQQGEISAVELVEAAINRIERLNPVINAVVATNYERALDTARRLDRNTGEGLFQGVPYLVKDLTETAGIPTQRGSRLYRGHMAEADEVTVTAVKEAGMVVLGKTATPEFGLIGTTESLLTGPTANPWSLAHSPGGSSGGAGAAVASGMVPIASGSDGGGSIRIPASQCGVFGLKATMGLPLGSATGLPDGIAVRGALSRSVRDSALMLGVYARPGKYQPVTDPINRSLKVGLVMNDHFGRKPHPDVVAAVESTASLMQALGHDVEPYAFHFDGAEMMDQFMSIWTQGPKMARDDAIARGLEPAAVLEPWTLGLAAMGDGRTPDKVAAATRYLTSLAADPRLIGDYDVLLSPVLSKPPIRTGEQAPTLPFQPLYEDVLAYISYTPVANVTGMPGMSVPLHWNGQGLPIGSQFLARRGDDELLLGLAYQLERAAPWADRWAPHSAKYPPTA